MSTENQVHLIGAFRRDEAIAESEITPGMLCEEITGGTVQPHSTEGGKAENLVAEIDYHQGKTLTDAYDADARVFMNVEVTGNESQMFLKAGESVVEGEQLISAGDGTLIADGSESSGTTVIARVAVARETKDLSGSGAVDTLIRVRIL